MINKEVKYGFSDIVMLPAVTSQVDSRSQCIPFDKNGMLPLITSPMFSVVNRENIKLFTQEKIYGIYPRGCDEPSPITNTYVAYGLDEFILKFKDKDIVEKEYVVIDMANGHMQKLLNTVKEAKLKFGDKLDLMVGNIAHPQTYRMLAIAGADAVRLGIGSGSACFVEGTKISLNELFKNIEDVNVGDLVKTHDGSLKEVIAVTSHTEKENLIRINETISTKDHKYYVLHKKHENKVNDENIHSFAQWMEAKDLTDDYLLIDLA